MPCVAQCLTCTCFNKTGIKCTNVEVSKLKRYSSISCIYYNPNKAYVEDLLDAISNNMSF